MLLLKVTHVSEDTLLKSPTRGGVEGTCDALLH